MDVGRRDDRALVEAMRSGDSPAVAEFYRRFRPVLLVAAGRLPAGVADRETLVEDTLTDAAVYLIAGRAPVPMSVAGYLVRGLRNRVLNDLRARGRFARRVEAASGDGPGIGNDEVAVDACSSEYGRRVSAGPGGGVDGDAGGEIVALAPAVARLAAVLDAAMTADDRVVATWLAHGVTQHQIAEWLGLSDAAASKRVSRLRARLRAVAARHTAGAEAGDRRVLAGFLRRAGVAHIARLTPSEGRR